MLLPTVGPQGSGGVAFSPLPVPALAHQEPKPAGLNLAQIEELAAFVGEKLDLKPGGDLEPAIKKLEGSFEYLETERYFSDGGTARIVVDGYKQFRIFLHRYGGLLHNRFAIAHELGHYILHSRMGKVPIKATHASDKGAQPEEWEATMFAAALLMPRTKMNDLLNRAEPLTDYELSSYFSVSREVVERWRNVIQAP